MKKKYFTMYSNDKAKRKINKIKLFANKTPASNDILEKVKEKLLTENFEIVDDSPDLAIAIGGDGTFLRMIKKFNYDSNITYVGINAGTLGFLQEVKIEDIDLFIMALNTNSYKMENIGVQETSIETDKTKDMHYSLNEIVIREKDLNTAKFNIIIDDAEFEKFVGDGILIATSVGSTAYNLSFGGSIVYNTLHTLQITPIAPLNSKTYRPLLNSLIIPENIVIEIIPSKSKSSLLLSIDGDNKIYNNVRSIKTVVTNKRIICLRLENYNFFEKISDKFISN